MAYEEISSLSQFFKILYGGWSRFDDLPFPDGETKTLTVPLLTSDPKEAEEPD